MNSDLLSGCIINKDRKRVQMPSWNAAVRRVYWLFKLQRADWPETNFRSDDGSRRSRMGTDPGPLHVCFHLHRLSAEPVNEHFYAWVCLLAREACTLRFCWRWVSGSRLRVSCPKSGGPRARAVELNSPRLSCTPRCWPSTRSRTRPAFTITCRPWSMSARRTRCCTRRRWSCCATRRGAACWRCLRGRASTSRDWGTLAVSHTRWWKTTPTYSSSGGFTSV